MSTHNIDFNEEMAKIIFQLSSNTHFICFSRIITASGVSLQQHDIVNVICCR